jgi:hypothetical protein
MNFSQTLQLACSLQASLFGSWARCIVVLQRLQLMTQLCVNQAVNQAQHPVSSLLKGLISWLFASGQRLLGSLCNMSNQDWGVCLSDTAHGDARLYHLRIFVSCRWARGRQTVLGQHQRVCSCAMAHKRPRSWTLVMAHPARQQYPALCSWPSTMSAYYYLAGNHKHT